MKQCSKCKRFLSLSEFGRDSRHSDGLTSCCKKCRHEYQRAYRQSHKKEMLKTERAYRQVHKEKIAERLRAYQQSHRKEIKEVRLVYCQVHKKEITKASRAYCRTHGEEIRKRNRVYNKTHRSQISEHKHRYYIANAEKIRAIYHRRRAKMRGGEIEKFSGMAIFERDGWTCGICGRKINRRLKHPHPYSKSLDHIIPIVRGGGHTRLNVQAAHLRCNISKHANDGGQLRLIS